MLKSAPGIIKYFLPLSLVICISCSNLFTKNKSITIQTKIYCYQCIYCSGCKTRIENFIKYIKGVSFTKFDLAAQTITLQYNSRRTNPVKLRKAIAKFGYDADDVKADTKAYQKLFSCCKKTQ